MRLYALGDIHVSWKFNRDALKDLQPHPRDGLILCGDVGEKAEDLRYAFEITTALFKHVFWVPGNHELYTTSSSAEGGLKGVSKYQECVAIAQEFKVRTPEDPFMLWAGEGGPCVIALVFTLYDYSFRPAHVAREDVLKWAEEGNVCPTDEAILFPDPYPSRDAWCEALISKAEQKLAKAAGSGAELVIVNHWPLREDLITLSRIERFSPWCGTKKTELWHQTYNAKVVVTGHLHVRRTDWIDGVRFEECSLGYPKQWEDARKLGKDVNDMLREILPGPDTPTEPVGTIWRRCG